MANYCNHSSKRNSTNQFHKLDIRKLKGINSKSMHEATNAVATVGDCEVEIISTPCNYGGYRYWWKCPGCGGRFACLYQHQGAYKCRHCLNAVHPSTQSTKNDRAISQMWKIIGKYGIDGGGFDASQKPKRMHWKTWWRIRHTYHKYRMADLALILACSPNTRAYKSNGKPRH